MKIITQQPETVLQPSLHSPDEYADLCLDEAESRGIDVADLRREINACNDDDMPDILDEVTTDALDRITDAGYTVVQENDTLLIWPKDYPWIEPADGDYVVSQTRGTYYVCQCGKVIEKFDADSLDQIDEFIREHMAAEQYWPSVWMEHERGDFDLMTLE